MHIHNAVSSLSPLRAFRFCLFVQSQRRRFKIGKDGRPTLFTKRLHHGALGGLPGCSNQLLADRLQRVSGRAYPTAVQPNYQAYSPTPSSACNGNPPIVHQTGRASRHAEMNILNKINWASNPPRTITFCISYPSAGPGGSQPDRPCPACQQTINQVCACVDQIYVCDENNNPEPQCPP